ncbi:lipopolysaccharide biosynthesis protein [Streptomyces sp. Je 1-79]|uniref:lipopolysaccharide biosynthesis protein n=1 Tax=Streptomyces sp. Je 1-79 TaxID=2943847 RepID=UPI0021A53C3C|nr:lipopolysaccharide biosynthesis protein [Streptomyces sp. Je 1-79]MCT4356559.1 lipopolysaccharide biosynthesis protein [Streptomyces sp. Je 1-79]
MAEAVRLHRPEGEEERGPGGAGRLASETDPEGHGSGGPDGPGSETGSGGSDSQDGPGSDSHDGPGSGGDSMFRNAYALMLSTGVSAALGLGFWLVAARYYSEEAVGQGSAAIAAQRLLASLTATTMIGAVVRYVPRAGRATGPLVGRIYLVSSVVVALACGVFLLTLDWWGPSYAPLGSLSAGLFFTASCVGWALLTLQDGVLTGLRRAFWVPVGNAGFSVGKLLLLAAFATTMPVLGVFVSWSAAIALSVVPLGWLVFRRLIPRQARADRDREPPAMREIGRFMAGDSVGALFSLAMINLLPVMVAVRFDAAHNAFFYTAYTVGGTMEFMAINMASSLTAHASHSPESLAEGVRGALRRMALLLVPVVVFLIVFAPYILAPFGPDYADHGTTVLRLLAAAALPRVAVELYIGVLRVQGRTGALAVLQGTMCALVLGAAALLLGPVGISGAGLAMLGSMTLMAAASAPGLRAALRGGREEIEYGTTWARRAAEREWAPRGASADTVTPAFGLPVYVRRPPGSPESRGGGGGGGRRTPRGGEEGRLAPRGGEDGPGTWLWLLLGLSTVLFWLPLARAEDLGLERLSGAELIAALPPVTLTAGILLVVLHGAVVSPRRVRPLLAATVLLATFLALHTAPPLLGIRPDAAAGPGAALVPAGALEALPVVLQALCLALAAVLLRVLGASVRITACAVWVLVWAGWAAQHAFAAAPLPVVLGVCGATMTATAVRGLRRR